MIGYLDCASGISGDKFLAALVGAGASAEAVRAAVAAVDPACEIVFAEVVRGGVAGLGVTVSSAAEPPSRTWRDIRAMIERAELPGPVARHALAVFELLAEAEARVHGTTPDEVHFHEVGAIDSIADVVGACAAFADLGVTRLVCSTVAVGSGTVRTAHGTLPVPAPATALLLEGVPVAAGETTGEATTPTGAALVRVLAHSFGPLPAMVPSAIGHGAGTRETPGMPNVARLIVGDPLDAPAATGADSDGGPALEPVTELVTTVDHLSAEHLANAAARLLAAGALDVWQAPVTMKKGRAGVALTVLAHPGAEERLAALTLELTGSLGVRARRQVRYVAPRACAEVDTSLGRVRVKVAGAGAARRVRAEYDDLAAIASREDLPVDRVARIVEAEAERRLDAEPAGPAPD